MKYVALSTDANPAYAIYAPIVTRLWRHLGYEPLLVLHEDAGLWDTPFGHFMTSMLPIGTRIQRCPTMHPLNVGNTMRCVRLAAAAFSGVNDDDFIVTSDMDMAPLNRERFVRLDSYGEVVLDRGDGYGNLETTPPLLASHAPALLSGLFRFPLCYVGMKARIWRELFPLVLEDIPGSLRRVIHGLRADQIDFDEACCSARVLLSKYAIGSLQRHDDGARWTQGEMTILARHDWATRDGYPIGMLIHAEGRTFNPSAIDFHMPKAPMRWVGNSISWYWPEEAEFINNYWPEACSLAGATE